MCWATSSAVVSNNDEVMRLPRPVWSRSRSAATMPSAANVPPRMSITDEPARSGRSGSPVM